MKSVSLTSFRDHVASKHEDRDKGFESEYQVSKKRVKSNRLEGDSL